MMSDFYLYLSKNEVEQSQEVSTEDGSTVNIDYDEHGVIVGIEVLNAEYLALEKDGTKVYPGRTNRHRESREHVSEIERLPWVDEAGAYQRCEALRWNAMPLKMLGTPPEDKAKYRCEHRGKWRFLGLPATAEDKDLSGFYCWQHLINHAIFGSRREEERVRKWMRENPQEG